MAVISSLERVPALEIVVTKNLRSLVTLINPSFSSCFFVADAYLSLIARLLGPGGKVVLRTFSDKEPPGPGPHRFSKAELESLWSADFVFEEFRDGIFEGPRKPKAWFALLRKKG